jgi:hypothetical protein
MAITIPARTNTTIATCVQIQNGDMQGTIRGASCARIAARWNPQRLTLPPVC